MGNIGTTHFTSSSLAEINKASDCFDLDVDIHGFFYIFARLNGTKSCHAHVYVQVTLNSLTVFLNPVTRVHSTAPHKVFQLQEDHDDAATATAYSIRQETRRHIPRKIGYIDSECGAQLIEIRVDTDKFEAVQETASGLVDLYALERLDYERASRLEFRVLGKCGANSLWSRVVRVKLVDANDNEPRFEFPVANGQVLFVPEVAEQGLIWLAQVRASDADASRELSALKYAISGLEFARNACSLSLSRDDIRIDELEGHLF